MTSCAGCATVACPCRDADCVIVAPLLDKAREVVIPVAADEVPELTCKRPGRLARAVKEAWSIQFGAAFPKRPSVSAGAAREEARSILGLAFPMILTGLLLYLRSMISMLFLGRLGGLALAGGSLAIGFANITGYSVLSGLAMGMEPICGQAFRAGNYSLLGVTMQRTVLLLIAAAVPIGGLWVHMRPLLLLCGQDAGIAAIAETYILASLPDLLLQAFLHPVRIYLRTQSINLPLTVCATLAIATHLPINYVLVTVLGFGIKGVAFASVLANLNLLLLLLAYIFFKGVHKRTGGFALSGESFRGWGELISLALPSCDSVCLEWWWYEIMILLCGLLLNPQATVASMGILIQATSLIHIFPSSLSFGVSTRVSNELGAGRPEKASRAATVGLMLGFAFGAFASAFAFLVRNVWASMFTADQAIIALTASVFPILGLCELGNCPQTTGCGVLRGSARPKDAASILRSFYLFGTPVALVLAFWLRYDFKGLWLGLLEAQATCMVRMLLVIGRTDWAGEARRSRQLTGSGADTEQSDDPSDKKAGEVVIVPVAADESTGVGACAPESERNIGVASGGAIPGGGRVLQFVWSWMSRLSFNARRIARGWSNTFRLDCSTVGRLISPVTQQYISLLPDFIRPIMQPYDNTCSVVASTVAVDATHRFKYGFDWRAAEPEHLLKECERNGIWRRGEGAAVEDVLNKIRDLGGVPIITNPAVDSGSALCPRLPLSSWDVHQFDDDDSDANSRPFEARMAELLRRGPCVVGLWLCPWYRYFDASRDDGAWVYRGCGRNEDTRRESKRLYDGKAGSHAVVCLGYRICDDGQTHVLVLDNHQDTGPRRWIHADEIDAIYTLNVECLHPDVVSHLLQACSSS